MSPCRVESHLPDDGVRIIWFGVFVGRDLARQGSFVKAYLVIGYCVGVVLPDKRLMSRLIGPKGGFGIMEWLFCYKFLMYF